MPTIEQTKLFSSLNPAELEFLRASAEERHFAADEVIFREGDDGTGLFVLWSGQVEISGLFGQDQRRSLARIGPGDYFGEMAAIDAAPRSASAIAIEPAHACFIPRDALLQLIETSPRLAVNFIREFSLRMREFNRKYLKEAMQADRLSVVGRFARSIIHDFKNPLNVIGLSADLMNLEKATPEMRRNALARIRHQVDRLANMSNELLEFTRGPQCALVLASVNYRACIQAVLSEIGPDSAEHGVEIVARGEPPDVTVLLDQKRLLHVFNNLVHNATEAMPSGGKIFISFSASDTEVITEVEDTGPGIAPEIFPQLFEAFATFGKARGTGLGLSICKRIIQDHRGWIRARCEPGRGAIFTFGLPIVH